MIVIVKLELLSREADIVSEALLEFEQALRRDQDGKPLSVDQMSEGRRRNLVLASIIRTEIRAQRRQG